MKKILTLLTLAIAIYACKKEAQGPTNTTSSGEKVSVKVALTGDITTTNEALGAKTIGDITVYSVNILTSTGEVYGQGIYTTPDSIILELLKNETYTIKVTAVKKGSGGGLDNYNGSIVYLSYPYYHKLDNQMHLNDSANMSSAWMDSLAYAHVYDTSGVITNKYFPELDSYTATTTYSTGSADGTLSISLRRISFGIEFHVYNLESGSLTASYGTTMVSKLMTGGGTQSVNIFTTDQFRSYDSTVVYFPKLTLTYKSATGTSTEVGSVYLAPKRNQKTIINVTLPDSTSTTTTNITLGETDWSETDYIDF